MSLLCGLQHVDAQGPHPRGLQHACRCAGPPSTWPTICRRQVVSHLHGLQHVDARGPHLRGLKHVDAHVVCPGPLSTWPTTCRCHIVSQLVDTHIVSHLRGLQHVDTWGLHLHGLQHVDAHVLSDLRGLQHVDAWGPLFSVASVGTRAPSPAEPHHVVGRLPTRPGRTGMRRECEVCSQGLCVNCL